MENQPLHSGSGKKKGKRGRGGRGGGRGRGRGAATPREGVGQMEANEQNVGGPEGDFENENKPSEQSLYEEEMLKKQKMMTSLLTQVMNQKKMELLTNMSMQKFGEQ